MNKKVLSAILFSALFAGTGTFTSCIDTDEPEGIENLRGAKAELIRAKVEVEKANAAYTLAAAEYQKALAAHEQANAEYRLAETKWMEAKAEYEEASTAVQKAYAEKMMAQYKLDMEYAAAQHEQAMLSWEKSIAETQYAYEKVLKQIEIAKAIGSLDELSQITLTNLQNEVTDLYAEIYGGKMSNGSSVSKDQSLVGKVRKAEKDLYFATLNKTAGMDSDSNQQMDENASQKIWIPTLERKVAEKKALLETEKEILAKAESFLDADADASSWGAKLNELNDSIKLLDEKMAELEVKIAEAKKNDEYLAAYTAKHGVKDENGDEIKKGTETIYDEAVSDYDAYVNGTTLSDGTTAEQIKLELTAQKVEVNATLATYINAVPAAKKNEILANNGLTTFEGWNATDAFSYGKTPYDMVEWGEEYGDADQPVKTQNMVQAWIDLLDEATISENEMAVAQLNLNNQQKLVDYNDSIYQLALADWAIAKNVYAYAVSDGAQGKLETVPTTAYAAAKDAYNTQLATFLSKLTAYNTEYATIVSDAKAGAEDAIVEKSYNEDKYPARLKEAIGSIYGTSSTEYTNAGNAISLGVNVITNLETILAGENPTADEKKARDKAKSDAQKEAQNDAEKVWANKSVAEKEAAQKEAATKALTEAAKKDKALYTAQKAIKDEQAKLVEKYNALLVDGTNKSAATNYKNLAANPYLQTLTADAVEAKSEMTKSVATQVSALSATYSETQYPEKYEIADSDELTITAEEFAAATETEPISTYEQAFKNACETVFGINDVLLVAPSWDAIPETGSSKATALKVAQNTLATYQEQIAAADDLEALKEEVIAVQTALNKEIADNAAKFDDLKAAILAAEKADKEADAALLEASEEVTAIEIESAMVRYTIAGLEEIKDAVEEVIATYFNQNVNWANNQLQYNSFEEFWNEEVIAKCKGEIEKAEKAVALAERNLTIAKDGKYDTVADAQLALDDANLALENALAKYEKALADLETALAIMAGEESAE